MIQPMVRGAMLKTIFDYGQGCTNVSMGVFQRTVCVVGIWQCRVVYDRASVVLLSTVVITCRSFQLPQSVQQVGVVRLTLKRFEKDLASLGNVTVLLF